MKNRIREVRERLGISRRALSQKAGMDYHKLFYLEKGEYPFFPKYQKKIAEALGVPIEELIVKDETEVRS